MQPQFYLLKEPKPDYEEANDENPRLEPNADELYPYYANYENPKAPPLGLGGPQGPLY